MGTSLKRNLKRSLQAFHSPSVWWTKTGEDGVWDYVSGHWWTHVLPGLRDTCWKKEPLSSEGLTPSVWTAADHEIHRLSEEFTLQDSQCHQLRRKHLAFLPALVLQIMETIHSSINTTCIFVMALKALSLQKTKCMASRFYRCPSCLKSDTVAWGLCFPLHTLHNTSLLSLEHTEPFGHLPGMTSSQTASHCHSVLSHVLTMEENSRKQLQEGQLEG